MWQKFDSIHRNGIFCFRHQVQEHAIAGSEAGDKKASKNRIAQQRYRQRQKEKKQSIQQQLQTLNRRLATMELERNSLTERHRILQRLAQFADQKNAPAPVCHA